MPATSGCQATAVAGSAASATIRSLLDVIRESRADQDDRRRLRRRGRRMGVVRVAAGRQGQAVDEIVRAGEADRAVGGRREGEGPDHVGAGGRGGEGEHRVEQRRVIVVVDHESLGRDDLQDAVHRRAEPPVRLERGDERLARLQRDGEGIDIPRLLQPTVDHDPRRLDHLRLVVGVVRLGLGDLRQRPDDEGPGRGGALLVVEPDPVDARRSVGGDRGGEAAPLLSRPNSRPGRSTWTSTGQGLKVPPAVTSTVVPRRAPAGKRWATFGASAATVAGIARRSAVNRSRMRRRPPRVVSPSARRSASGR